MRDPRDDIDMCVGYSLCDVGSVHIGEYVAQPDNQCWRRANRAGILVHIAFARIPFEIQLADRLPQVASASSIIFANGGQPFRKDPLDDRGEWTDWISFDPAVATDVVRPMLPCARSARVRRSASRPVPVLPDSTSVSAGCTNTRGARRTPIRCASRKRPSGSSKRASPTHSSVRGSAHPASAPSAPRPDARTAMPATRGAAFLATNCEQRLSLSQVSRYVGVAPAHFCRMFRREFGVTVHAYLTRVRLAAALDQLEDFEGRTVDLAVGLGFSGRTHLVDAMRAGFGAAPTHLLEQIDAARRGELRKIPDT